MSRPSRGVAVLLLRAILDLAANSKCGPGPHFSAGRAVAAVGAERFSSLECSDLGSGVSGRSRPRTRRQVSREGPVGNRGGTLGLGESRAGAGPRAKVPAGGADLHPEPDTPVLPSAKSAAVSLSEPALSAAEWSPSGLRLGQRSGPHFAIGLGVGQHRKERAGSGIRQCAKAPSRCGDLIGRACAGPVPVQGQALLHCAALRGDRRRCTRPLWAVAVISRNHPSPKGAPQ